MLDKDTLRSVFKNMLTDGTLSQDELREALSKMVDRMTRNKHCDLCGGRFIGRNEKDTAIVLSKDPVKLAHKSCWVNKNDD